MTRTARSSVLRNTAQTSAAPATASAARMARTRPSPAPARCASQVKFSTPRHSVGSLRTSRSKAGRACSQSSHVCQPNSSAESDTATIAVSTPAATARQFPMASRATGMRISEVGLIKAAAASNTPASIGRRTSDPMPASSRAPTSRLAWPIRMEVQQALPKPSSASDTPRSRRRWMAVIQPNSAPVAPVQRG